MSTSTASYQLPDLVGLCGDSFELRSNPRCRDATAASLEWAEKHGLYKEEKKSTVEKQQLGLLASLCFPTCDFPQLKLVTDSMLFTVLSGLDPDSAYDDIWLRLQRTTSTSWQTDFQRKLQALRAKLSPEPSNLSLQQSLEFKRDLSGFLLGFNLIEYASGLDLPSPVRESPVLRRLAGHANDALIWMDEMASYNVRQASNDETSLITIMTSNRNLSIQAAMNAAAEEVKKAVANFLKLERELSTNGIALDENVSKYVQGLRDWIIGFAHWVYETDAHFLGHGEEVKAFGWVFMLPESQ